MDTEHDYLLSFLFLTMFFLPVAGYAQSMDGMTNSTMNEHAVHTIDNLVISEHIPLIGQLAKGDYLFLIDLTPFATSIEGHSHVAAKIPCNNDGSPKLEIITGTVPRLNTLNISNPILNGTVDGESFSLSDLGNSCLYHSELPKNLNDIVVINTSNDTLNFENGGYSIAVTVHGTAIQHDSIP